MFNFEKYSLPCDINKWCYNIFHFPISVPSFDKITKTNSCGHQVQPCSKIIRLNKLTYTTFCELKLSLILWDCTIHVIQSRPSLGQLFTPTKFVSHVCSFPSLSSPHLPILDLNLSLKMLHDMHRTSMLLILHLPIMTVKSVTWVPHWFLFVFDIFPE